MTSTPSYSTVISCLYDEPAPIGHIGCGSHYSVFRAVEWLDVLRTPLTLPEIHDFAVIWDIDHDKRVIDVIERIYLAGLLPPVQFIGEHKACLTVVVAAKFLFGVDEPAMESYNCELKNTVQMAIPDDWWSIDIGSFDRSPASPHQTDLKKLLDDTEYRGVTYARNIDFLWNLGTRPPGRAPNI